MLNLFNKNTSKDSHSDIRNALNGYRSELFPNGIYGQISVSYDKKIGGGCRIGLPFITSSIEQPLADYLKAQCDINQSIEFYYQPTSPFRSSYKNIKLIVAVASGKGGVGKSTVTANLAATLAKLGHKVGVLDADIYGPSMPMMFGLTNKNIQSNDGKTMEPFVQHGVALNSIGFVVPDDKATIWRGPMASKALMQVLNETNWPELDILLVDMPPGTGDIQLTLSQSIKCDAALIVTTPQNIALADAEKGINMFNKVNTPVVGVVENMSQFICGQCGAEHQLFGSGGAKRCADDHKIPLLAQLPLKAQIRQLADNGAPYAIEPLVEENKVNEFHPLAFSLMMQLSKQISSTISVN